jgi:RNA 3'-terminal phosphate cyclase (ATP)
MTGQIPCRREAQSFCGRESAERLYTELSAMPTVDAHLADMLIPYVALAKGTSAFLTRTVSDHLDANIWLAEKILGVQFNVEKVNNLYRIEKVG